MLNDDKRVRNIVAFLTVGIIATLGSVFIDRPTAILIAWVGGFLVGLVIEFRGRDK